MTTYINYNNGYSNNDTSNKTTPIKTKLTIITIII